MTFRPSLIGAATILALAAAAPAAAAPVQVYGGHTAQDAPIALRVAGSGRVLTQLLVHVRASCGDGTFATWAGTASFAASTRISRRGAFRATGMATDMYGDKLGTATQTIRGTIRGGVARGTVATKVDIVDPATGAKVASCRSGTLRWTARSAPGRVYAGLTSAGVPIVIERSRSGRKVDSMWVSWSAPCRNGEGWFIAEELVNFPVSGAGRFRDTFSDEMKVEGVGAKVFTYRLTGTAGASRAAGTIRVEITEKDAAGATADTCDSTPVSWSARSTQGPAPRVRPPIRRVGG